MTTISMPVISFSYEKNDLCMRKRTLSNDLTHQRSNAPAKVPPPSGSHPFGFAALRTPSPVDHCRGATKAQFSMGDRNALEDAEVDNLSTNSDFKYGPGIVKKLKAKFHRLSGIVSLKAKVSTHTGKRCPSMDDIVSCTEKELENGTEQKRGSSINSSSLSKKHSQSTGDMLEDDNERHFFTVYRQMEIRVSDFPEGSSISSLRRKFETDTQRRPSQNLRHAKVLNRATTTNFTDKNNDDEPEFIKVGRRLRRNSPYLQELVQHHETTDIDRKVSYTRRVGEIPKLSGGARIIRDDFHKDSNEPHDVDKQSPPDPDSARRRGSPTSASSPVVFVCTDDLLPNTDASPPPEEPQPSQDFNIVNNAIEYVPKACLSDNRKPVVPQVTPPQIIPIKNDESGVTEMLRLLDKFQRSRDERRLEDSRISQTPEVAINMHSQSREHTSRHPAVDAIPMHCSTNSHAFSLGAHHSLKISQPNIVNISVGSSTQKFHSHKDGNLNDKDDDDENASVLRMGSITVARPDAPYSTTSAFPHSEQLGKSLSARYIEEKFKAVSAPVRDMQCDNEITSLKQVTTNVKSPAESKTTLSNVSNELNSESMRLPPLESTQLPLSNNENVESAHKEERNPFCSENDMIAGDGNPIRHTLLSLVMEEDIPDLMEAMNENFTCEFEDLNDQTPSTSSILHPPAMRKERRKARQISSIRFEETVPKVYTYLDEMSAIVHKEWVEGVHVDYETYQSIIAAEVEEYKKSIAELKKWKESIAAHVPKDSSTHENRELTVDVSSSFTYATTHNENNTISV